jgi:hypothetical protein
MPQMGYDTKTDRLTVSRKVTLTLTLFGEVFSVLCVLRCYTQDISRV